MTAEAIEQQRREMYEIVEAIAPTSERRRADIEEASTPSGGFERPSPAVGVRRTGAQVWRSPGSCPPIAFARG